MVPQDGLITDVLGVVGGVAKAVGTILGGPDANGALASAWVGPQGGTVKTAAYTLVIPANAVSVNTRFDIEPTNDGKYSVELHAYQQGLLGLVDVGGKGFQKPVALAFSYANAVGVENPKRLVIIYIRPDGVTEKQTSSLNTKTEVITGTLNHFSKYAMAEN
jgi:hypothetical protein